ncbi:MAG: hypothetical protein KGI75_01430 [Rhizobiaceae bacterium]|nr:hypothetical protein [Rhizobiaceae bacterium]
MLYVSASATGNTALRSMREEPCGGGHRGLKLSNLLSNPLATPMIDDASSACGAFYAETAQTSVKKSSFLEEWPVCPEKFADTCA